MCKLIQRSSMLCVSVILTVLLGAMPVQAQENSPGFSANKVCVRETVTTETCFIIGSLEICVVETETKETCIG